MRSSRRWADSWRSASTPSARIGEEFSAIEGLSPAQAVQLFEAIRALTPPTQGGVERIEIGGGLVEGRLGVEGPHEGRSGPDGPEDQGRRAGHPGRNRHSGSRGSSRRPDQGHCPGSRSGNWNPAT